jgi:hypothetical protein
MKGERRNERKQRSVFESGWHPRENEMWVLFGIREEKTTTSKIGRCLRIRVVP